MLPVDRTRDRPLPEGETWATPQPLRERLHEAGEVIALPRRKRWWRMADITENTRIAIKAGSVFGALLVVFAVGTWYGDLRSDRAHTTEQTVKDEVAQGKIDDRQDAAITQLQTTVSGMNTTLQLIKQAQDKDMPQLIRQSSYATEVLRDIEVALAAKGILTKEHGP